LQNAGNGFYPDRVDLDPDVRLESVMDELGQLLERSFKGLYISVGRDFHRWHLADQYHSIGSQPIQFGP
jgi:hypothetical protein